MPRRRSRSIGCFRGLSPAEIGGIVGDGAQGGGRVLCGDRYRSRLPLRQRSGFDVADVAAMDHHRRQAKPAEAARSNASSCSTKLGAPFG